jgi:hypothetical protein
MSNWRDISRKVIADVHGRLDPNVTFKDRKAAIDGAYPFGPRQYHPYKMWLVERKTYLARWSDKPAGPLLEARP